MGWSLCDFDVIVEYPGLGMERVLYRMRKKKNYITIYSIVHLKVHQTPESIIEVVLMEIVYGAVYVLSLAMSRHC